MSPLVTGCPYSIEFRKETGVSFSLPLCNSAFSFMYTISFIMVTRFIPLNIYGRNFFSQSPILYPAPPHEEFFSATAQARDSFRSSLRILSTFGSIRSSKSRQQGSISDTLESSRPHYVGRICMHLASDEPQLPLRLRRRNMLLSCLIPLSLTKPTNALADQIVEDTSNKIGADNGIHGDGFGFDGLGTSEDDYAAGKVVALAQAGDGAVLFLGVDGFDLPLRMVVGVAEAMAILTAAQERRSRRPVTHEAWGSSLAAVGWKVDRVTITNMESDVFYSRLVLSLDPTRMASSSTAGDASTSSPISDRLRSVDMRPSDGIALALRCRAPLYISKKVAEEIVGALKKGSESGKRQPNPLERPGLQANRDSPVVDSLSQSIAQYKSGLMAFIVDDEVYKKSLRLPGKD